MSEETMKTLFKQGKADDIEYPTLYLYINGYFVEKYIDEPVLLKTHFPTEPR